jgi:hypothetical protein
MRPVVPGLAEEMLLVKHGRRPTVIAFSLALARPGNAQRMRDRTFVQWPAGASGQIAPLARGLGLPPQRMADCDAPVRLGSMTPVHNACTDI